MRKIKLLKNVLIGTLVIYGIYLKAEDLMRSTDFSQFGIHGKYSKTFNGFLELDLDEKAELKSELREAVVGEDFELLFPYPWLLNQPSRTAKSIDTLVFEPLMEASLIESGRIKYGRLVDHIEYPADYSSVKIYLRDGIQFSDGSKLSQNDLKVSFQLFSNYVDSFFSDIFTGIEKTNIDTNAKYMEFTFNVNSVAGRDIIYYLGFMKIVKADQFAPLLVELEKFKTENILATKFKMDFVPLGTGPYIIENSKNNDFVFYSYNENYWGKKNNTLKKQFNFKSVKYYYYKDIDMARMALQRGDINLWKETNYLHFLDQKGKIESGKSNLNYLEHTPIDPGKFIGIAINSSKEYLLDVNLRKALVLAYEFGKINSTIFSNSLSPITSIFRGDYSYQGVQNINLSINNSEKRKNKLRVIKLLAKAGWKIENQVLQKNGEKLKLKLIYSDPNMEKVLINYKTTLERDYSIELRIDKIIDKSMGVAIAKSNDYDLIVTDLFLDKGIPIVPAVRYYLHSNSMKKKNDDVEEWDAFANLARISNSEIDHLIESMEHIIDYQSDEMKNISREIDRLIQENCYFIPLGADEKNRYIYSNELKPPKNQSKLRFLPEQVWLGN